MRFAPTATLDLAAPGRLSNETGRFSGATRAQQRRLARYAELTGLEFVCIDPSTGVVLDVSRGDALRTLPGAVLSDLKVNGEPRVRVVSDALLCGLLPLPDEDLAPAVAVTLAVRAPSPAPADLVFAAIQEDWPQDRLDTWVERQTIRRPEILRSLLDLCYRSAAGDEQLAHQSDELQQIRERLEQTEGEIGLLHNLSQSLQLSRSTSEVTEACLARLHGLIEAGGSAVWLEEPSGSSRFIVRGRLPFDELGMARIAAQFEEHDWSLPLTLNGIDRTLLGGDFPGLRNLVLAPIAAGTQRFGWMASCNLPPGREFGAVEGTLVNSIARMLGTHVSNVQLGFEQEKLLLCFVRSLIYTIDAKDQYTRGHSERVALVARRLGEELSLPDEELRDVYLSGLLHDVGKIGVDDCILRKMDQLTDEEFREVQKHPVIGYSILSGLKSLRRILPGIRNHHETFDGRGYPDGLKGEEIPLMARILGVADSYDAMSSDRSYRKGLSVEKLEAIFHDGAGTQWDPRVIDAYFACADDIRRLCADYSPADGCLLSHEI